MLMYGLISLYRYSFPDTVKLAEIQQITIILANKPEFYDGGEYNDPEISFEDNRYSGLFKLTEYASLMSRRKEIQNMQAGDSLKLLIIRENLIKNMNSIEVCGIEDPQHQVLLSLEEYNHSKENEWTDLWMAVLILNLIMVPAIIRKLIKKKAQPE